VCSKMLTYLRRYYGKLIVCINQDVVLGVNVKEAIEVIYLRCENVSAFPAT
jgi:hypothetical protein